MLPAQHYLGVVNERELALADFKRVNINNLFT